MIWCRYIRVQNSSLKFRSNSFFLSVYSKYAFACLLTFRCIKEFNEMNKYSLFAFFSWNMLAMSSILITFQFQLVEYTLLNIHLLEEKNAMVLRSHSSLTNLNDIFLIFIVDSWLKSIRNCPTILRTYLHDNLYLSTLWTWCTNDHSIRSVLYQI